MVFFLVQLVGIAYVVHITSTKFMPLNSEPTGPQTTLPYWSPENLSKSRLEQVERKFGSRLISLKYGILQKYLDQILLEALLHRFCHKNYLRNLT